MEFLVILTAWALQRLLGPASPLHRDRWLAYWHQRAGDALAALPPPARLLAIAALPCLALQFAAWLLAPWLAGSLLFLLQLVTLLYSLGRGDLDAALHAYLERWRRGDFEAAYRELEDPAEAIQAAPAGERPAAAVDDRAGLHAAMRGALVYAGFERWFAVVFWFFLLGPAAALFYRLLQLSARLPNAPAVESALLQRWVAWLEWLPARLLGLAFAVAGNFVGCFRAWRGTLMARLPTRELLLAYADQALAPDRAGGEGPGWEQRAVDELVELRALLARAAVAWLVLFALVQLVF